METIRQNPNMNIHQQRPRDKLEVEELSRGVKVRSEKPHLVSLGGGRLSTAVTLLPLDEGITRIGSSDDQHIRISGPEVNAEHCYIENQGATLTLCPLNKSLITVDGERVLKTVVLTQGCMLCLGRANYFRFNHPEQAMKLRGTGPLSPQSDTETNISQHSVNGEYYSKGQACGSSSSEGTRDSICSSDSRDESLPSPHRSDDLAEQSFKNKLKRFENLSTSQLDNSAMSPPPNANNFSYHNFVGEKLFTRDTNTTRLSAEPVSCESFTRRRSLTTANNNNDAEQTRNKPPKPEVKPKPTPGAAAKSKLRSDMSKASASSSHMSANHGERRGEFKTLSMISTETSIWGSTSSAGTVRLDDDLQSPLSCHTPTDDLLDDPDVFTDEMTASLTMKHQQMIEERKLEEDMERKEQERLEEILAMCAQYEEQIDSESKINSNNSPRSSSSEKTKSDTTIAERQSVTDNQQQHRVSPPRTLTGLTTPYLTNFDDRLLVSTKPHSQLPDVLSDSINSVMSSSSSSYSDRKNIKTNGSLIHSPTSPRSGANPSMFSYNNNKITSTSNPTYIQNKTKIDTYQDDERLYDCPADLVITSANKEVVPQATTGQPMVLNSSMTASIYADDDRIYDSPADIMIIPPPVPAHQGSEKKLLSSEVTDHSTRQRNTDSSSSSELTVVSSAASYKTAVPDVASPKTEDVFSHLDSLKYKRSGILETLGLIKQRIMEVESQQTEAVRELEMEQALLQGEQQTELNTLQNQWEESDMLKSKRLMVMNNYAKQQDERLQKIEEAREKLQRMEMRRVEIEEELRIAPDDDKDELLAQYEVELDALENQKKIFEDLEFQQLEMEAKFEEETEAVQRELNNKQCDLVSKIKRAEDHLANMTRQQTDMMEQTRNELDDMERQRKILVSEFQREKEKLMSLDHKMKDVRKQYGNNGLSMSGYYADQDEMILQSPAATLNKNLIARLKPGDILMEEERRRLESLKHAATEASILQWHEQRSIENNLRRFGTLDSEEENMSTRSSETPSDADKISYNSSMDDQDRFSELQLLLAQARHHVQNAENTDLASERKLRVKLELQLASEKEKREEIIEHEVKLREKTSSDNSHMRPLTRYLPVRESEFDLRSHVESTGHNLGSCPFVEVTPTQCKGYLMKMGTKMKTWNKRWFVFDREKKALLYYSDKSESKPRGGIYFQSIEDVFVDHMRTVKSPNQKFTFCVKTYDKPYYLVAKSPEALSIWIDVIFTGAEGYQEF